MRLLHFLAEAGHPAAKLTTEAAVHIGPVDGGGQAGDRGRAGVEDLVIGRQRLAGGDGAGGVQPWLGAEAPPGLKMARR